MPTLPMPTDHIPDRLPGQPMDLDSFAAFLGICRKTVERYARDGQIRLLRIGRRVLVPDSEVRRVAEHGLTGGHDLLIQN